jgi:protoporphyrinogen/coproporphyrinogen III oxidase
MALDDTELLAVIRRELASILGIMAMPLFTRVFRWQDGYPQYEVGHLERVSAIEAALPDGLRVAGSAFRGIGVPDCIRQGQEAARAMKQLRTALTLNPSPKGLGT